MSEQELRDELDRLARRILELEKRQPSPVRDLPIGKANCPGGHTIAETCWQCRQGQLPRLRCRTKAAIRE